MFLPTLSYISSVGYPLPHMFLDFFLQILENSSTSFKVSHLLKGHTMFLTIRDLLGLESNYKAKRDGWGRSWGEPVLSCMKSTVLEEAITISLGNAGLTLHSTSSEGKAIPLWVGKPLPLGLEMPLPFWIERIVSPAKKTHQNLGTQCPQFHQGLPTCPHFN